MFTGEYSRLQIYVKQKYKLKKGFNTHTIWFLSTYASFVA